MIDVHCHLNFHKFEEDMDEVIARAFEKGITKIVNVGTSFESSRQAVEIAQKDDRLYAIVGIHPHHADKVTGNWIEELSEIAQSSPKVIGIGEIGLDYFSYKSNGIVDPEIQKHVFEAQIDLAHRLDLPLQIHNRQAGDDVIQILQHHRNLLRERPGTFHCFAGSFEVLKAAFDLGFYIGFDGNITYKGLAPGETVELRELCSQVPLDRLLIETDSPFLTPIPLRGTRNTPQNAIIIGEYIADLKNIDYKTLEAQVDENFNDVFGTHL